MHENYEDKWREGGDHIRHNVYLDAPRPWGSRTPASRVTRRVTPPRTKIKGSIDKSDLDIHDSRLRYENDNIEPGDASTIKAAFLTGAARLHVADATGVPALGDSGAPAVGACDVRGGGVGCLACVESRGDCVLHGFETGRSCRKETEKKKKRARSEMGQLEDVLE